MTIDCLCQSDRRKKEEDMVKGRTPDAQNAAANREEGSKGKDKRIKRK